MTFKSNDSIKFMMAKIFLHMAEFSYQKIAEPTIYMEYGLDVMIVNYIESGKGKLIIDEEEFDVRENYYFVVSQFSKCQIIPDGDLTYYSIYFVIDKTTAFKKYVYLLDKNFVGLEPELSYPFSVVKRELEKTKFGYNEIVVSMFKAIIVEILRNEKIEGERLSHWDLNNFQFQIDTILRNEFQTITIEDLANRLFISVRELQRYLNENYKKTFIELKNEARMSFASNKLLYSDLSITEISELVGYSSIEHFTNAFKKWFGLSPLKYRKSKKHIN